MRISRIPEIIASVAREQSDQEAYEGSRDVQLALLNFPNFSSYLLTSFTACLLLPELVLFLFLSQRAWRSTSASTARWKSVWWCEIRLLSARGEGAPASSCRKSWKFIWFLSAHKSTIRQPHRVPASVTAFFPPWCLQGFRICHLRRSGRRGQSFGPKQTRAGLQNSEFSVCFPPSTG